MKCLNAVATKTRKAKMFLKKIEQNIKINKTDKSNKMVIMDSKDYVKKMTELLNEQNTYKKMRGDKTQKL